ncbi:MAG: transglycosylase SLT domain-containing protein [Bacteroidales bacterium]|nr:transglycosylase SLT domain-containing protein [Bacteroidales bacterium]
MKNRIYILSIILTFLSVNIFAQNDKEEDYFNYERNYNDLLNSYYIQTNEKLLNEKFPLSQYASSPTGSASLVSDDVYQRRLKSIPSAVELTYNQQVRNHIIYYLDRMNKSVSVMLGLSKYYFPLFEDILDSYGVPTDLKYLVVIESAFNPKAVSRAGATGLWQFMYSTGRMYSLRENSVVDDRRDPIKSTEAAAKFLRDLYNIYNDWTLAIASYNCGPGNVNKAIKRSGGKTFWEIYDYLPQETRNYVPAFIAATYVMNFYNEHGITPAELSRPLALINDTVIVNKDVYFGQIAEMLKISEDEISELNPQYKMAYIPGSQDRYSLKLPFKYIDTYIELEDTISKHNLEKYRKEFIKNNNGDSNIYVTKTFYHKVKNRETWSSIARRYGVSVSSLRSWNKKIKRNKLSAGTMLLVKQKVAVEKEKIIDKDESENKSSFEQNEIVEANNSGNQIESSAVKKVNSERSHKAKQSAKTNTAKKDTPKQQSKVHSVKKGETLSSIAKKYGTTEQKIMKLNNMDKKSANKIKIGQKIKVK